MFLSRVHRKCLLLLLAGLMLVMRVGDVHLHLCFDGNEPPATVRTFDYGNEHINDGTTRPHQDAEVDASSGLAKATGAGIDMLPAPFLVIAYGVALPGARLPHVTLRQAPFLPDPAELLPPLRGPPAAALT